MTSFVDFIAPLKETYSANSSNDDKHLDYWVKSASNYVPYMNKLLEKTSGYKMRRVKIRDFYLDNCDNFGCILYNYRTHKVRNSSFYIMYNYILGLLGGENASLKILEVGIGTSKKEFLSFENDVSPCAALRGFKEYLPHANIYGADIDRGAFINEPRIQCAYVDQMDPESFEKMHKEFDVDKFHVIIDDGIHALGANLNTLLYAVDKLEINGWFCIENIDRPENYILIDYILATSNKFQTYMIECEGGYENDCRDWMYVIQKIR